MWLCKRDLSKECEGKYRDCTDCVLDKIRAEIDGLVYYWCEVNPRNVIDDVLKIIDKYRAESEVEE